MGEIISFYSYKGGVGRSMALANLATLLAQSGARVLVVDFDLEAPGLHRYFAPTPSHTRQSSYDDHSTEFGTIDFFHELSERLSTSSQQHSPQETITALLDSGRFGRSVSIKSQTQHHIAQLDFWSAGRFDKEYATRVHDFPWARIYEDHREAFTFLAQEWKSRYDYVLLDSRTGISDLGSVSTVILADKLVLAFTLNEQSLHGVTELGRQAAQLKKAIDHSSSLALFPLLSRVDEGEEHLNRKWSKLAARRFAPLFEHMHAGKDLDLLTYFSAVRIPHRGYYSYGERIAVTEEKPSTLGSLSEGYERFLTCLLGENLIGWDNRIRNTVKSIHKDGSLFVNLEKPSVLFNLNTINPTVIVPEQSPTSGKTRLRDIPINKSAWQWAMQELEHGVERAARIVDGTLHVYATVPYPAAVYLGRCLDDIARVLPVQIHQLDPNSRLWSSLFRTGITTHELVEPYFQPLRKTRGFASRTVLLAIEGMAPIPTASLEILALSLNASLYHLSPNKSHALSPRQGVSAVEELRSALIQLQGIHMSLTLHIVATAPISLMIELGRMLSPTVYQSVIVYQYDPATGAHVPVLDIINHEVIAG